MYEYFAVVTNVYDGDTITVTIDLGFGVNLQKQKIRLQGINAPDIQSENKEIALLIRDWLRDKLLGKTITIKTAKDKKEKYGRYLAVVFLEDENINDLLQKTFSEVVSY